jgi:hypothetical protein
MENWRAEPLSEGEATIFVIPLDVPLEIAVSLVPCQVIP